MAIEWSDRQSVSVDQAHLISLARHVLAHHGISEETNVGILLVDEPAIAELNAEHLDKPGATDVLAFPVDDPRAETPVGPAVLGDVVLCPSVARAQAGDNGRSAEDELALLLVHGLLHLLGMDHDTPRREDEMFGLTDALLSSHVVT